MKKMVWLLSFISVLLLVVGSSAATLNLPSSLITIEEEAFAGDASLDLVVLGNKTQVISERAFADSSVKQVTMPASISYIADNAFEGVNGLTVDAAEGTYAYAWAVKNSFIKADDPQDQTRITLPDTLKAGRTITISITGSKDASHHIVYVVNSETDEYRSRGLGAKDGKVTFDGDFFDPGVEYRVVVYTITKKFTTLEPVTSVFQVTGNKPETPELFFPDSIFAGQSFEVIYADCDDLEIEGKSYSLNNELIGDWGSSGDITTFDFAEKGVEGRMEIQYAIKKDNVWSEWRHKTVKVIQRDYQLSNITIPAAIENGSDYSFTVTHQGYVSYYIYRIFNYPMEENEYETVYSSDKVYLEQEQGIIPVRINTMVLEKGSYTFRLYLAGDKKEEPACVYETQFSIEGNRESKVQVSVDHTEVLTNSNVTFKIESSQAELVGIRESTPFEGDPWTFYTANASGDLTEWVKHMYFRGIYRYSFCIYRNGKWTDWNDAITITVTDE